jgi:hypothetical protein
MLKLLAAIASLSMLGLADDAKQTSPPVIPDSMLATYFQARAEKAEAADMAAKAAQRERDAINSMRTLCGNNFELIMDPDSHRPACIEKPAPK